MYYTKLGNSDLSVSRICLGCMGFGDAGNGQHSWTIDEAHSREIIKRALELGVNFFDTAIGYQSGTSEQYVGRAVRDFAKRENVVVATKFLPRTEEEIAAGITGQQHIERMLNTSLRNLGLDYVDLYIYHMWDYQTPLYEIMDGLNNMVKAGKTRYIGISNCFAWTPGNHVAVKLSTGEPGSNYLRTDLIGGLVQSLDDPTIVECNTAYGGSRANTAMHYQVAADHGYTAIANVDIMDADGSISLPVLGGANLTENYVGANFTNYDSFLVLSHFKGHAMAGFGGAIKNISIGIASSQGKSHIHSGGTGGSMWGGDQDAFLESMAEAGKSVVEAVDGKIVYINVMNRLSVDCDCDGNPAEPDMHDIGILASYDPVALDQACVDLVYAAEDGRSLINRMESRNGLHTLEHAEEIGLGSRTYQLINIDQEDETTMNRQIKLSVAGQECIATLRDNPSADDLYNVLPLELTFEDFNQTEKISYPPKALTTEGMPDTFDPDVGDLCLYAPWGNLCIFYRDFRESTSLIPLGHIESGMEVISSMTGDFTVTIEAVN